MSTIGHYYDLQSMPTIAISEANMVRLCTAHVDLAVYWIDIPNISAPAREGKG